jgi:hypothetical protein
MAHASPVLRVVGVEPLCFEFAPGQWVVVCVCGLPDAALPVSVLVGLVALAGRVLGQYTLAEGGAVRVAVASLS